MTGTTIDVRQASPTVNPIQEIKTNNQPTPSPTDQKTTDVKEDILPKEEENKTEQPGLLKRGWTHLKNEYLQHIGPGTVFLTLIGVAVAIALPILISPPGAAIGMSMMSVATGMVFSGVAINYNRKEYQDKQLDIALEYLLKCINEGEEALTSLVPDTELYPTRKENLTKIEKAASKLTTAYSNGAKEGDVSITNLKKDLLTNINTLKYSLSKFTGEEKTNETENYISLLKKIDPERFNSLIEN